MSRTAVVGGGISGVTAAYALAKAGHDCSLYEASARLGGTVETTHFELAGTGSFVVELGPDGWVGEKPWAAELASELGLADEVIGCNESERRTLLLRNGELLTLPAHMRMMVPTDLDALTPGKLFSEEAIRAYRDEPARAEELKAIAARNEDVTVADFVRRHFGEEVNRSIAAPLLAGVFGGDVEKLGASSVMPAFVAMEREHGSLVSALAFSGTREHGAPTFRALRSGLQSLIRAMEPAIGEGNIHCNSAVTSLVRGGNGWLLTVDDRAELYDSVVLATPAHVTRALLSTLDPQAAAALAMPASSAIVVALLYSERVELPRGFGFLVEDPAHSPDAALLATTFMHQKYPHTTPAGGMLLRVFFGGSSITPLLDEPDAVLAKRAAAAMFALFPTLPQLQRAIVRRWPRSLPQYHVGHQQRMRQLSERMAALPGLHLLGNAYHGVGLPDLVRDARKLAAGM